MNTWIDSSFFFEMYSFSIIFNENLGREWKLCWRLVKSNFHSHLTDIGIWIESLREPTCFGGEPMFLARGRICEAPNFKSADAALVFKYASTETSWRFKIGNGCYCAWRRRHKSTNTIYSDGQLGRGLVPSVSLKCQQHGDRYRR